MEKQVHHNVLIEVMRDPGANDRDSWGLYEFLARTEIATNFVDHATWPIRESPNMG